MVTAQELLSGWLNNNRNLNQVVSLGIDRIGDNQRRQLFINDDFDPIIVNWPDSDPNLDLAGLTGLQVLNCSDNQLTALDLSSNINLRTLDCSNNPLTTITGLGGLTMLSSVESRDMPQGSSFAEILNRSITVSTPPTPTPAPTTTLNQTDLKELSGILEDKRQDNLAAFGSNVLQAENNRLQQLNAQILQLITNQRS